MIEKDHFYSVVLEYVAALDAEPTFQGATCLAKGHASFYRLSEGSDSDQFGLERATATVRTVAQQLGPG